MNGRQVLFQIADSQQGYFTTQQALEVGFYKPHFNRKLKSGEWVREGRGIYRLVDYPITERPELVFWSLWSRNREGIPQGVWSHETALDIHDLSDVMPDKMHMTVPIEFRRQSAIPKILWLHRSNLVSRDFEERQGFKVTTPLRTILDVVREARLHDGLLFQAVRQASDRGLVLRRDFIALKSIDPVLYAKLQRLLGEKYI